MTYNYAVLALCKEVGITPEDEKIQESVQSYIEGIVEAYGGIDAYKKALKAEYLTDSYVRFNASVDTIESELFYVYTQDLELIENNDTELSQMFLNGECARTLHVFVQNDKGESVVENRALAENIRKMYLDGTSMDELIAQYNQDLTITTKTGLYFTCGQMEDYYEEAAFATEIGGVSEVVEADDGFFVIFRLELDEQQVVANYKTLKEYYQYAKLGDFIKEKQDEIEVELNDFGKSIDFVNMK
jgi:foldase protein PrsA